MDLGAQLRIIEIYLSAQLNKRHWKFRNKRGGSLRRDSTKDVEYLVDTRYIACTQLFLNWL